MKNIDRIINHPLFIMSMKKIHDYEIDRVFCCHGIEHSLDVARVAYITNLEQNLGFQKEMIYAAALLHDIGRWRQYEKNIPHEEAGAALAADILEDTAFSKEVLTCIIQFSDVNFTDIRIFHFNYLLSIHFGYCHSHCTFTQF